MDLLSSQKRVDALDCFQLFGTVVVDGEFVERSQCFVDYFRQCAYSLVCLYGLIFPVDCCSLSLLVKMVLPALCQKHKLRVLPFPKLNQPIKLKPANVFQALGIDSNGDALFRVDKSSDNSEKRVEAVHLFEECFGIGVKLIQVIG